MPARWKRSSDPPGIPTESRAAKGGTRFVDSKMDSRTRILILIVFGTLILFMAELVKSLVGFLGAPGR
jgi:hypothetical protein